MFKDTAEVMSGSKQHCTDVRGAYAAWLANAVNELEMVRTALRQVRMRAP